MIASLAIDKTHIRPVDPRGGSDAVVFPFDGAHDCIRVRGRKETEAEAQEGERENDKDH